MRRFVLIFSTLMVFAGTAAMVPAGGAPQVRITFSAMGDIHFGRPKSALQKVTAPFAQVEHLWKGRDMVYGNLETPVAAAPYRNVKSPKDCRKEACTKDQQTYFYWYNLTFWTRPSNLTLLKAAGFTVMGTANNHVEDQGPQGLLDTITHLKAAGLFHSGTGATEAEAWTPYVFEKLGVKVAFLAVTALHNLPASRKGAFFAASLHPAYYTELPAKVRELKKTADFVVVALHYGQELETRALPLERKLVESLEAAGCDLFIGGHPHVLRGIQVHKKMVAFYSMGNFLFLVNSGDRVETGVAAADFVKDAKGRRLENVVFHPVLANGGALGNLPRAVTGENARRVLRNMIYYSKQFSNAPGSVVIDGDRIVVKPNN